MTISDMTVESMSDSGAAGSSDQPHDTAANIPGAVSPSILSPSAANITSPRAIPEEKTVSLSWCDITYEVPLGNGEKKQILRGLTGTAQPNRLLAIMGGSGAGKTTLLNAMSQRLFTSDTHVLDGKIFLNNTEFTDYYRNLAAFVTQDDVVFDMATPYEALYFSARVRNGMSAADADARVNEVLNELLLSEVRNQVIGTPGLVRGLSGGERKRTNIGVELITDPKVLLLDEPTSGLDSVTAEKVMTMLRDIAREGRTVICTIHQPSADIVNVFDDLLLMAKGKAIFHGPAARAVDYFKSIGYECPEHYTPTDYFMMLMQNDDLKDPLIDAWEAQMAKITSGAQAKDISQEEILSDNEDGGRSPPPEGVTSPQRSPQSSPQRKKPKCAVCALWKCKEVQAEPDPYLKSVVHTQGGGAGTQVMELYSRSFKNLIRDRFFLVAQLGQSVVFALIAGLVFVNLGHDQASVQDRTGLFFMLSASAVFTGATGVVNTFHKEKAIFVREQQSGAYSTVWYFLAKMLAETPFHILFAFTTILLAYFMAGLRHEAWAFFSIAGTTVLAQLVGVSLGLLVGAASPNYQVSSAVVPVVVIPMVLSGGLLTSAGRLDPYWLWLNKISIVRYAYIAMAKIEFGLLDHISCDVEKFGADRCAEMFKNGQDVIHRYEFDKSENDYWVIFVSLAALFVFFRLCALACLFRVAKQKF